MLREYTHLQRKEEPPRRWFSDEAFDLVIFQDEAAAISRFELCYGKGRNEHALIWSRDGGYSHYRVDDGEGVTGRFKMSPILLADGPLDSHRIAAEFREAADSIDREVTDFVCERLLEFRG